MSILSVLLLLASVVQEPDKRSSPFTKVRWKGDVPIVEFGGDWYTFVSMNGVARDKIAAFLKKEHDEDWKKRFGEDLVEAMEEMGSPIKDVKVALVLEKDGKPLEKTGTMTKDNRRSVRDYNREHPELIEAESERRGRPRRPSPRVARNQYEFESAKIVYRYTGDFEGTDTLYVMEKGKVLALDRDKKIGARIRSTTFIKDGQATTSDHLKQKYLVSRVVPMDTKLSVLHANDRTLERIGFARKGTVEIAGKPCVLYEKKDGEKIWRSWRWKGIELKIEFLNYLNTSYVKEAVSVDEGITAIPAELMKIPEGYAKR